MRTHFVPIPYDEKYLKLRDSGNQKHNVMVAIMDTGVSLGSQGLIICPDGKPKILDTIDCTGSDDVIVKVTDPRNIQKYVPILEKKMDQGGECKYYCGKRSLSSFISDRSSNKFNQVLRDTIDHTVLDVIIAINNDQSVCLVDYDGDLNHCIVLKEYDIENEYGVIPLNQSLVTTFGYHLYQGIDEDEKICSLIFDSGEHGTHVAGIIAGNHPDPMMNGVNPMAQILSLKIGDSRVDGMETSISLIRALHEIVKHGCHIVNYSFGEPLGNTDGRFIEMLNEFTYKHNITFITSAGNSGPCISTVGAPATATANVISVGACVNNIHLSDLYFMMDPVNPMCNKFKPYHWSSRGPGINDSMGVDVMAIGCALTSHPKWHVSDIRMCNGTSMSAPNATGFVSLLLSQFRDSESYPHTFWIKKYLESTCEPFDNNAIDQGHGLIGQKFIPFDYFDHDMNYYYKINCNDDPKKQGIVSIVSYDTDDTDDVTDAEESVYNYFNIDVQIHTFTEENEISDGSAQNKIMQLKIIRETSDGESNPMNHIIVPDSMIVHPKCRYLRVGIPEKREISEYIKLYEMKTGRIVQYIPVNQFRCMKLGRNETYEKKKEIVPGVIDRTYLIPKCNGLKIQSSAPMKQKVYIEIIQYYKGYGYDSRNNKMYTLNPQEAKHYIHKVIPGIMTEITVYTEWFAPHNENIELKITGVNKDINVCKNLYEMNENVILSVVRDYEIENEKQKQIKGTIEVNNVQTRYQPTNAELIDLQQDTRYKDKCNKNLKLLRLSYNVKKHSQCTFFIDTNNRVYDSKICMSGTLRGFKNGREIFHGNYVPKKVSEPVDTVFVEFMDSDENELKKCTNTLLIVQRNIDKQFETLNLSFGVNTINLEKAMMKLNDHMDDIYSGDIIHCNIMKENFVVIYRKMVKINDPNKSKQNKSDFLDILKKDFTIVKYFLNQCTGHQIFDIDGLKQDDTLKKIREYNDSNGWTKDNHHEFISLTHSDRNDYVYLSTLIQIDGSNNDKLKEIYQCLSDQKLLSKFPYCVIDLGQCFVNDKSDGIKAMKIIKLIESLMDKWKDISQKDINSLYQYAIDLYSKDELSPDRQKLKRKFSLITETTENVTF